MDIFASDLERALASLPIDPRERYCVVHIAERAPFNFREPLPDAGVRVHQIVFRRLGDQWVTDNLVIREA